MTVFFKIDGETYETDEPLTKVRTTLQAAVSGQAGRIENVKPTLAGGKAATGTGNLYVGRISTAIAWEGKKPGAAGW